MSGPTFFIFAEVSRKNRSVCFLYDYGYIILKTTFPKGAC